VALRFCYRSSRLFPAPPVRLTRARAI
jgi:hypothetical protein